MEIPVPSLATIEAGWKWALENVQRWFHVLQSPSSVLKDIDLDSLESILAALQFSIFPISLSIIIELPIYLLAKDTTFGLVGYVIAKFVAYFAIVFIFAVCQRVSAKMLFGKGTMNACVVATLYATAFWPLVVLAEYTQISNASLLTKMKENVFSGLDGQFVASLSRTEYVELAGFDLMTGVLGVYLLYKFVPVAALTHRVGRLRASMICLSTMIIGQLPIYFLMLPLSKPFFGI
jgi:hypothetical protein